MKQTVSSNNDTLKNSTYSRPLASAEGAHIERFLKHGHPQHRVKYPLLDGLEAADLRTVLAASRQVRYPAGAVISSQGEPADRVFLLVRGRARFFLITPEGEKVLLIWLPEGEAFGGASITLGSSSYIVSTEAIRDSVVLTWDKATFRSLAHRFPAMLENCIVAALEYLTFYVATHLALITHSAPQRLAAVLYNLAQGIGHEAPAGIELDIRNEELAQAANVTAFTTSRQLNKWQREGILTKSRGKILLLQPHKLFRPEVVPEHALNPAYWWLKKQPASAVSRGHSKAS